MHRTAWEFEYASNFRIYHDGRVPGDSMHMVTDLATGETRWVDDQDDGTEWPHA
jgi:hypothetical protein